MDIKTIEGATRIIGESQGYLGLPLRDEAINCTVNGPATPSMLTAWQPSSNEVVRLIQGAPVHLRVLGTSHPPVMITVGEETIAPDWSPLSLRIAEAVLLNLGIGADASQEPGADGRRDRLCQIIEPLLASRPVDRYVHVKTGRVYEVLGDAKVQISKPTDNVFQTAPYRRLHEGDSLTVYRGADGRLWARFPDEFNDGRFVALDPEQAEG